MTSYDLKEKIDNCKQHMSTLKSELRIKEHEYLDCFKKIADIQITSMANCAEQPKIKKLLSKCTDEIDQLFKTKCTITDSISDSKNKLNLLNIKKYNLSINYNGTIADDEIYKQLQESFGNVTTQTQEQILNLQELFNEAQSKLTAYKKPPYHNYLKTKGFTTDKYHPFLSVLRIIDSWLTQQVQFSRNLANETQLLHVVEQVPIRINEQNRHKKSQKKTLKIESI